MKVAVVGSRNLLVSDLQQYLPDKITEIVSGGARGVDTCARKFAHRNGLKLTEFLPDYRTYGKSAPIKRNLQIIAYADIVIAFWDKKSRGTKFVIDQCKRQGVKIRVFVPKESVWEIVPEGLHDFSDDF